MAQIPGNLQQYNSYVVDPQWARKFTIAWTSVVAAGVIVSLPHFYKSVRQGRAFTGIFGVTESWKTNQYVPVEERRPSKQGSSRKFWIGVMRARAIFSWTLPGFDVSVGQMLLIAGYFATLVSCILLKSELSVNSNRAGFMAVSQLPVVFLFASKNSIISFLSPGHGYEKLNFVHRWAGRGLFLSVAVHGSLWIAQDLRYGLPIIGQQKETSGISAFGVLCIIVLTSVFPVRRWFYQGFFIVHTLGYAAFFITICVHTPYAEPWIFPCLAFYGLDLLFRMIRSRVKDAVLIPIGKQMTLINIHDCDQGWHAGQHVRLRVFFDGRLFESHPLTILNAPVPISNISCGTLTLGSRTDGDWSEALHAYAQREKDLIIGNLEAEKYQDKTFGVPVQVMIDGPYGGCSIDLGEYESVLLFSGGSGVTFTLGMLDDIVGRVVRLGRRNGERTKRIEFAWCIPSFGQIQWVAPMLADIATAVAESSSLDLHISIYVTCLCDPEAVPPIPNSVVTADKRPTVDRLLNDMITPPEEVPTEGLRWVGLGGGLGVCVSGPGGLTRDMSNAVARLSLSKRVDEIGGVALHTETFML